MVSFKLNTSFFNQNLHPKDLDILKYNYILGFCLENDTIPNKESVAEYFRNLSDFLNFFPEEKNYSVSVSVFNSTNKKDNTTEKDNTSKKGIEIQVISAVSFAFFSITFILTIINYLTQPWQNNQSNCFNFISSFYLYENLEECFSDELVTRIHNDNGLGFVKGLRGIGCFATVLGLVCIRLFQFEIKFPIEELPPRLNPFYIPFFFGIRIAPRLLFSVSGLIFAYKFLSFMDSEVEKQKNNNDKNNSKEQSIEISINDAIHPEKEKEKKKETSLEKLDKQIKEKLLTKKTEKGQNEIKLKSLFKFFAFQLHKFVIGFMFGVLVKYSLELVIFTPNSSSLIFFNFYHGNISNLNFWGSFFFAKPYFFFVEPTKYYNQEENQDIMLFFFLFLNEVFFFSFFTLVFFICYKLRKKLMNILIGLFIIFVLLKYLFYARGGYGKEILGAADYYIDRSFYGEFSQNPLYNISTFIIGCFFGTINYVAQKGYNEEYQGYLSLAVDIWYLIKCQARKMKTIESYIGVIILIILLTIEQIILLVEMLKPNGNEETIKSYGFSFFYLIDVEITIFIIYFLIFIRFAKGESKVVDFLSKNFWNPFHRMYFGFILNANFIALTTFYLNETKVTFTLFSIYFYAVISCSLLFFWQIFNSVFLEFPLKKVIYFIRDMKKK